VKVGVVIVCAGRGERLGSEDKAVLNLGGIPLFCHSLKVFESIKEVKQIVLVLRRSHFALAEKIISAKAGRKKVTLAEGGRERKDSVCNGLGALGKDIDYVLVHDGARPFIKKKVVERILEQLRKHPSVICAVSPSDTLKYVEKKHVKATLSRGKVLCVQTPQGFKKKLLIDAYAKLGKRLAFDDAQAVEYLGRRVKVIEGDVDNIKITYPQDLKYAKKGFYE